MKSVIVDFKKFDCLLEDKRALVPMSIAWRPKDLAASVGFADRSYYGSTIMKKPNSGYTPSLLGEDQDSFIKIDFKTNTKQKEFAAIRLDLAFQEIDSLFPKEQVCYLGIHSCGTYASHFFLRLGVPIVSPGYLVPEAYFLTLLASKVLGLPTVKKVTTSKLTLPFIAVFTLHGTAGSIIDTTAGWLLGTHSAFLTPASAAVQNYFEKAVHTTINLDKSNLHPMSSCTEKSLESCCELSGAAALRFQGVLYCKCLAGKKSGLQFHPQDSLSIHCND